MSNPYISKFADLPLHRLTEILTFPSDFDPLAVEAAENELMKRQVPQEEVDALRKSILAKALNKEATIEQSSELLKEGKRHMGSWFYQLFVFNSEKNLSRRLTVLVALLSIFASYRIITEWDLILFSFSNFNSESLIYFVELGILCFGVCLLAMRHFSGWILINIWLISSLILSLYNLAISLKYQSSIIQFNDPVSATIQTLIYVGVIIYLHKPEMRIEFLVSKKLRNFTVLGSIFLVGIIYFPLIVPGLTYTTPVIEQEEPDSRINTEDLPDLKINTDDIQAVPRPDDTVMRIEVEK